MNKKNIEAIYPLTPLQEGMLFHRQLMDGDDIYSGQIILALRGKLDSKALDDAWRKVIARHQALRSVFVTEREGRPLQLVMRTVTASITEYNWRGMQCEEQEARLQEFLARDREQGFDLSKAPLMRFSLIRLSETSSRFIWSHHHLLLDGWSVPLILDEVMTFYAAACRGEKVEMRAARPYRDYIAWLSGRDMKEAERYWRSELKGFQAPLRLGIEKQVPKEKSVEASEGVKGGSWGEQEVEVGAEVVTKLKEVGKRLRLTMNTLAQGAWALLQSAYSGESDVVYGTTVSGRSGEIEGIEEMVGLLINTPLPPSTLRFRRTPTVSRSTP